MYDQSCPVMELLTSSSWEFLLSQVGHNLNGLSTTTDIDILTVSKKETPASVDLLYKERYKNFSCDISDDVREQTLKSEMAEKEKASGGGVGEAKQKEEEEKKEPGRRRRRNCDGRETAA
ncbi:hypothetical protein F2Q68_00027806 [Brassica cretica]|uniref:Uncharacterized protein n=1 Tax=Brassica cretica TaxID=69181 RepID=A0A8S9IJQ9_BRACR|nr:hypothetical protein F2Q68_00027806 [Brassica cretica]